MEFAVGLLHRFDVNFLRSAEVFMSGRSQKRVNLFALHPGSNAMPGGGREGVLLARATSRQQNNGNNRQTTPAGKSVPPELPGVPAIGQQ